MTDSPVPVPEAPTNLRLVSIEKDKNDFFGTFEWMDNATDEFGTGFQADNNFPWGAYSYSEGPLTGAGDYPAGTGIRTARHRLAVGEYDVHCYAENFQSPWPGVTSAPSNSVHINTRDASKGNGGKGSGK